MRQTKNGDLVDRYRVVEPHQAYIIREIKAQTCGDWINVTTIYEWNGRVIAEIIDGKLIYCLPGYRIKLDTGGKIEIEKGESEARVNEDALARLLSAAEKIEVDKVEGTPDEKFPEAFCEKIRREQPWISPGF
ncbi:MAG: hypothetical protein GXO63_02560 [Candidatus Micrarchaeota archaeon]|nr:hypothetical protein [Candidatus Micrarchaeota archaeon]